MITTTCAFSYDYEWEVPKSYCLEMRGPASFLFPKDDSYDKVFGGGIQCIYWFSENIGLSAGFDLQSWKLDEDEARTTGIVYSYDPPIRWSLTVDGSASALPISLSGLYKVPVNPETWITLELGIRYVIISSDFNATIISRTTIEGVPVSGTEVHAVNIEDGVLGFASIDMNHMLSDEWGVFGGGGYQYDVEKGEGSINGIVTGENELAGWFVRAGVYLGF